jgi:hypothetical protein
MIYKIDPEKLILCGETKFLQFSMNDFHTVRRTENSIFRELENYVWLHWKLKEKWPIGERFQLISKAGGKLPKRGEYL